MPLNTESLTRNLIIEEAERRGWQVDYIGRNKAYYRITLPDGRNEIFWQSRPSRSSANGSSIVRFKTLTFQFAESLGYRMPAYSIARDAETASDFLREHGTIVVKPSVGTNSEGVTVGVDAVDKLHQAITYARQNSENGKAVLQKQLEGTLYRLTIINGKHIAGAHRRAAQVAGNGTDTIRVLIEKLNEEPMRSGPALTPLRQVNMAQAEKYLGQDIERVPPAGEAVRVSAIESISAGGETIDVTAVMHEDWKQFMAGFSAASGLFIAGFDVICEDIAKPLEGGYVPLLEVNSAPGFMSHEYPTGGGQPVKLAPLLLDELFG